MYNLRRDLFFESSTFQNPSAAQVDLQFSITAIFRFQHNTFFFFLNITVISGLRKMLLRIALSYSPPSPMRSECAQTKPLLFLPTNQYLLQQRREGRTEDETRN